MKCYIYFIINQVTKERYVGQTTNFSRRKNEHFTKLEQNCHPNPKLQNAYNKYGKDSFIVEKITFDNLTKDELNEQEKYYIQFYDSKEHGYNLTLGGTGGDCRSKLTFDQYALAYAGNTYYQGMSVRTAKYLNVDSHCITSLAKDESYDNFRQQYKQLSENDKKQYLKKFEEELDVINNPPWVKGQTPDFDTTIKIMSTVATYKRGTEGAINKALGLTKGFMFHLITGNGRQEIKDYYKTLTQEQIQTIGREFFQELNLQSYTRIKLTEEFTDIFKHYNK